MVKPAGTGMPRFVISARPAPLPPNNSFMPERPSAFPLPKKYTYFVVATLTSILERMKIHDCHPTAIAHPLESLRSRHIDGTDFGRAPIKPNDCVGALPRSEERRVGKECRCRCGWVLYAK